MGRNTGGLPFHDNGTQAQRLIGARHFMRGSTLHAAKGGSKPVSAKISDGTLFTAIRDGGAAVGVNAAMPRWRESLDDQQIKALVVYVRSFCKR